MTLSNISKEYNDSIPYCPQLAEYLNALFIDECNSQSITTSDFRWD